MQKVLSKTFMRGAVVASACAALTFTGAPAGAATLTPTDSTSARLARPTQKLPAVKNLAMSLTKPSSAYLVKADWDDLTGATSYRVSLSSAGTVLASQQVTESAWSTSRALTPGTTVTVKVTALAGKRPGTAISKSMTVPDVTAPTGSYTVTQTPDTRTATVNQTGLQDDLTTTANIKRWIDWDTGNGFVVWDTGTSVEHTYAPGKHAYHPVVKIADEAGNTALVNLAVAIDDTDAPEGKFGVAPGRAFAKFTPVTVTQVGVLSDDVSAAKDIKRKIDWNPKDTIAPVAWRTGMVAKHVYTTAGTFSPRVTLTDEFGRTTTKDLPAVAVRADTVKPTATLVKPRLRRNAVRSWITLHGKASDVNGTGVRNVKVRVIENRRGTWFAYRAGTRTWVKAATKAGAFKKSRPATVLSKSGKWAYRVRGLRKGTLIVKVWGTDKVGNVSTALTYRQRLTRR